MLVKPVASELPSQSDSSLVKSPVVHGNFLRHADPFLFLLYGYIKFITLDNVKWWNCGQKGCGLESLAPR